MAEPIRIVDVDTHYTEPPDLWTKRAPASLRSRAPRVEPSGEGKERWIVDRDLNLGPPGFCVIRPDGSKLRGELSLQSFAEMAPGATDPEARLRDMDASGLERQIVYPNILGFAGNMIMRVEDEALRDFCIAGYNEGVAELQAAGQGRLFPQALLPFWNIERSVDELVRCHDEYGLTGFVLTDAPDLWDLPPLSDPRWDPLWEVAQDRRLPVNFHIGGGSFGGGLWNAADKARSIAALSTMAQMNNMRCIVNLIFSGLLDRFPELQFVSVESGVGWIPFLLESCTYQAYENGVSLDLTPHEYFQRQIHASFWFEQPNVASAIEWLGEDHVMFETDYPHPTCLYPDVQASIEASLGGLCEPVRRKVLADNANRLYGLPS